MKTPLYSSLLVVLAIFWLAQGVELRQSERSIAVHEKPIMDSAEAIALAKSELIVIDVENGANNPELLRLIKKINPRAWLIANIALTGTKMPIGIFRPIQSELIKRIDSLKADFWLRDEAGELVDDPREGGIHFLNVSADCPPNEQGMNYSRFAADFYLKEAFSNDIWDGFNIESSWEKVFEVAYSRRASMVDTEAICGEIQDRRSTFLDANGNNRGDRMLCFIARTRQGVDEFASMVERKKGRDFLVIK